MLIDHTWCLVGSANIDVRSFQLNFELSAFVESEGLNASLAAGFAVDTAPEAAKEVTLRTVSEWSKPQKVLQAAAHLLSPLL
jgi:cardiolipin synthase